MISRCKVPKNSVKDLSAIKGGRDRVACRMMQFQFKFLDKSNFVVLTRLKTIVDDHDALAEAVRLSATHTIEVWHGSRHVGRVKKGKAASWAMRSAYPRNQ
jgi:hypothetical protein